MNRLVKAVLLLFAVYFPVAGYLKLTYAPVPQQKDDRIWLTGPFLPLVSGGAAYIAELPKLDRFADSQEEPFLSTLVLHEDEKPIGPAHSEHGEISTSGHGRYSHWKGQGLVFSTTDNSDPIRTGNAIR